MEATEKSRPGRLRFSLEIPDNPSKLPTRHHPV